MSDGDWQSRSSSETTKAGPYGVPECTVLYDGVRVLCSAWFRFVAARDPASKFRFTLLQGDIGRRLAVKLGIDPDNSRTNAVIIGGKAIPMHLPTRRFPPRGRVSRLPYQGVQSAVIDAHILCLVADVLAFAIFPELRKEEVRSSLYGELVRLRDS